jgi:hypothetical protein
MKKEELLTQIIYILNYRIAFEKLYSNKVWGTLNSDEMMKRYFEIRALPWGNSKGWKNRIEKGPHIEGMIAPSGSVIKHS